MSKVHVTLSAVLDAAIDDGLILTNPTKRKRTVNAPSSSQIRAQKPEIITWTGPQLHAFPDLEPRRSQRRPLPAVAHHRLHGDAAQ